LSVAAAGQPKPSHALAGVGSVVRLAETVAETAIEPTRAATRLAGPGVSLLTWKAMEPPGRTDVAEA